MIIEFSGIDGAGKTTQLERLMRWANEAGVACFERKLRSTGKRVLGGIAQEAGHRSWRALFAPDAVELMTAVEMRQLVFEAILPISFRGQIIVTDTYTRSWVATAISWGASPEALLAVYRTIPPPDLSIHLDVESNTAYARILAREKGDHILRVGGRERLEALVRAYEAVPQHLSYRARPVSAESSVEETFVQVQDLVRAAARATGDTLIAERLDKAAAASPAAPGQGV
jgi:dTMP kinase